MNNTFNGRARLDIRFSFFLLNALIFLLRDGDLIFCFYMACAVHEVGHIIAILVTGGRIRSIELSGLGMKMETDKRVAGPIRHEVAVLLSGPFANLLVFTILKVIRCGGALPVVNLSAAVYNLLPYRSLDGGSVIEIFTSGTPHGYAAGIVLTIIKAALSAFLLVMIFLVGKEVIPLFLISIILFVGDISYTCHLCL